MEPVKVPDPRPNILLAESKTLSGQMTCKSPLGTLGGGVKGLFLRTKRGSRRGGPVTATALSSPQTTSSFLPTEAVFGTNMNPAAAAAAATGLVVLLLALSGTVDATLLLCQSDHFRDHECVN